MSKIASFIVSARSPQDIVLLGMHKLGHDGQPACDTQHHREIDEEIRQRRQQPADVAPQLRQHRGERRLQRQTRERGGFSHGIESAHELAGDDELAERRAHQGERRHAFRDRVARPNRVDDHAADDEDERYPNRHEIDVGCDDPQRELGDAIAGDVEQRAEQARFVALARDVAVEPVRHEDENDQEEARERPRRRRLIEQPHDEEQQQQPAQGHEVGHGTIIRRTPCRSRHVD